MQEDTENIEAKLHEAYDKLIEYPRRVQEIFNDFYGEEKVDLQGIPSYSDFIDYLHTLNAVSIIRDYGLMALVPEEVKPIVETEYEEREVIRFHESLVFATYVLPLCIDVIRENIPYRPFILVWFPTVRVTNEHDKYVDINNLYAKVPITMSGRATGAFFLNRSTYQVTHLQADYMHSHCPGTNLDNLSEFKSVCMGSGPIRATITSLSGEFNEDLWQLFCLELDKFTRVESLSGVPYRRLENISNRDGSFIPIEGFRLARLYTFNSAFTREDFSGFIKWLIKRKVLKFNLCPTGFALASTYHDTIIKLSNEFIKYWNTKFAAHTTTYSLDDLKAVGIIRRCICRDGVLYEHTGACGRSFHEYEGAAMFTFKGKVVKFHIIGQNNSEGNEVILITNALAQNVLKVILEILNYNYGRAEERKEGITSSNKGRYYI